MCIHKLLHLVQKLPQASQPQLTPIRWSLEFQVQLYKCPSCRKVVYRLTSVMCIERKVIQADRWAQLYAKGTWHSLHVRAAWPAGESPWACRLDVSDCLACRAHRPRTHWVTKACQRRELSFQADMGSARMPELRWSYESSQIGSTVQAFSEAGCAHDEAWPPALP